MYSKKTKTEIKSVKKKTRQAVDAIPYPRVTRKLIEDKAGEVTCRR